MIWDKVSHILNFKNSCTVNKIHVHVASPKCSSWRGWSGWTKHNVQHLVVYKIKITFSKLKAVNFESALPFNLDIFCPTSLFVTLRTQTEEVEEKVADDNSNSYSRRLKYRGDGGFT
jgi:hypothetical protein